MQFASSNVFNFQPAEQNLNLLSVSDNKDGPNCRQWQTAMKKTPCHQSGDHEPLSQAAPDLAIPESPCSGLPGCPASADNKKYGPLISLGPSQDPFAAAGGDNQDIEDEISDCHNTRKDEKKSPRSLVSSSLCLSLSLSVSVSIFISLCLSLFLSPCLSVSLFLSLCLFSLPVSLSFSVCLSVFVCLSLCLPLSLLVSVSISLFLCLSCIVIIIATLLQYII